MKVVEEDSDKDKEDLLKHLFLMKLHLHLHFGPLEPKVSLWRFPRVWASCEFCLVLFGFVTVEEKSGELDLTMFSPHLTDLLPSQTILLQLLQVLPRPLMFQFHRWNLSRRSAGGLCLEKVHRRSRAPPPSSAEKRWRRSLVPTFWHLLETMWIRPERLPRNTRCCGVILSVSLADGPAVLWERGEFYVLCGEEELDMSLVFWSHLDLKPLKTDDKKSSCFSVNKVHLEQPLFCSPSAKFCFCSAEFCSRSVFVLLCSAHVLLRSAKFCFCSSTFCWVLLTFCFCSAEFCSCSAKFWFCSSKFCWVLLTFCLCSSKFCLRSFFVLLSSLVQG